MTEQTEHDNTPDRPRVDAAREGAYDEQLRFDSPLMRPPSLIRMVIKRDGREEAFDKGKIAAAIFRAAETVGEGDRDRAESLAAGVTIYSQTVRGTCSHGRASPGRRGKSASGMDTRRRRLHCSSRRKRRA